MKSLVYNNVMSSYSLTLLPYSLDIDLGNGVQVIHGPCHMDIPDQSAEISFL